MREMDIKPKTLGLYAWRSGHHAFYSAAGNQLKQAPKANRPGEQWVGEFTYIKTGSGWLYHAAIMDLYTRKIIGWSFSRKRNAELTKSALRMALDRESFQTGFLFHSDQCIEYAAHDYRLLLESAGLVRSMSRKGNPLDNAAMQSFFGTLKAKLIHHQIYQHDIEAVATIISYIQFYNRDRLHSALVYQSPESYEKLCT